MKNKCTLKTVSISIILSMIVSMFVISNGLAAENAGGNSDTQVFTENFEIYEANSDFSSPWSSDGSVAIKPADTTSAHGSDNASAKGKAVKFDDPNKILTLKFDAANYSNLALSFWYRHHGSTQRGECAVTYSIDGGATYIPFSPSADVKNTSGTSKYVKVGPAVLTGADGKADVRVRFSGTENDNTVNYIVMDDVSIDALASAPAVSAATPEPTKAAKYSPPPVATSSPMPTLPPAANGINTMVLQINNPNMVVNGQQRTIDAGNGTAPVVIDGRTLLPIRSVIETLGGTVSWDDKTQKVKLYLNSKVIEMTLDSKTAYVNGAAQEIDVPTQTINDRTMVPLRFVAESLGYDIKWDEASQKATITFSTKKDNAVVPKNKKMDYLFFDEASLEAAKAKYKNGDPEATAIVSKFINSADDALKVKPFAVTDKTATPPSGDKHDYMSIGIYWWPNPDTPDGKPYIRKDGRVNPETRNDTYDKNSWGKMSSYVQNTANVYYFTGNEAYANYSAKLLKTFFLDPETRMNPNMNYAQAVPGVNDGRAEGVIETESLGRILDAAILLNNTSNALSQQDMDNLKAWVADYLNWLRTSDIGKEEFEAKNNHGEWFDAQAVAYAIFTGQHDIAKQLIEGTKVRISEQIQPDGALPLEMGRTRSLHYVIYALRAFSTVAILAEREGIDLWNYKADNGISLKLAYDYIYPYLDGSKTWELEQVAEENESAFTQFLRRAAVKYNDPKYLPAADALVQPYMPTGVQLFYPAPDLKKK